MATYIPNTWHNNAYFGLHFDLHANEHDTELGADTTYAHIRIAARSGSMISPHVAAA